MKAIGYARVSTDRKAEQGVSLEAQEAKIRAMATVQGADLLEVIVDGGESAKNLNRPGLRRLIAPNWTGSRAASRTCANSWNCSRSAKWRWFQWRNRWTRARRLAGWALRSWAPSASGNRRQSGNGLGTPCVTKDQRGASWEHPVRVPAQSGREARGTGSRRASCLDRNSPPPAERAHAARDRRCPEPTGAPNSPLSDWRLEHVARIIQQGASR